MCKVIEYQFDVFSWRKAYAILLAGYVVVFITNKI